MTACGTKQLAELAGKQIKATPKELYDALRGRLTDHHRFLLELHLKQWDGIDEMIRKLDLEIDRRIEGMDAKAGKAPFRTFIELLSTIPGVSAVAAPRSCPRSVRHEPLPDRRPPRRLGWPLPGQNESAGKRKPVRLRRGRLAQDDAGPMRMGGQAEEGQLLQSPVLPAASQARTAESHLCRRRLDPHCIYHLLKDGTEHRDLGVAYLIAGLPVKSSRCKLKKLASVSYSNAEGRKG